MGSLEKRYAEALLSLAENVEQADAVGSALGVLARLYQKNTEFRNFILNPVISQRVRSETLLGILELLGYIKTPDYNDTTACDEQSSIESGDDDIASNDIASYVANAGVMLLRFLQLLLEKGRFAFLPNIAEEYNTIKAKHRVAIHIVARTAAPLDTQKLYVLREKYKQKYGAAYAEIDNIVEPSILDEIIVQIGDIRVDDTLYGRLVALSRAVAGGAVKQPLESHP